MSYSWLYDRRDQLDGYKPFAHIAYTLRRHVLPEDRDDIEVDIILKLKQVSSKRNGNITPASLWFVGRCMIADYWKRKARERRRSTRLYEVDKGEIAADSQRWRYVSHNSNMDTELDTKAVLNTLPERLKTVGERLVNEERLNTADKCYLSRQRAELLEDYNYHVGDTEAERIRSLAEKGLSGRKIAKMLGRSQTTIGKYLKKM
jgi:DNA-directed RNA polymerase specialized sigma24 family protein